MKKQLAVEPRVLNNKERFVIVDTNGDIVNDANGYGFKSLNKAYNHIISSNGEIVNKIDTGKRKDKCLFIKPKNVNGEQRYVIVNENGKLVDDAKGYGFKTNETAKKRMMFHHKNPIRDVIDGIVDTDKTFLTEEYSHFEDNLWYNFKDFRHDIDEMEEANKRDVKSLLNKIAYHFKIDIFGELRKTHTSYVRFLEYLKKQLRQRNNNATTIIS